MIANVRRRAASREGVDDTAYQGTPKRSGPAYDLPMGLLEGKVAFVTGAGRGQGRAHAKALAAEGADIIAFDICDDIPEVAYPMATRAELQETCAAIESMGRRAVAAVGDVRSYSALAAAVEQGVGDQGRLDIVVANAGVAMMDPDLEKDVDLLQASWEAVIGINLTGVWNTVRATAPAMIRAGNGGSIILTSSTAGLKGLSSPGNIGNEGYGAAKHGVVGLMRQFAVELSQHMIRVNSVHPTGVATMMIQNEAMGRFLEAFPDATSSLTNLLPVEVLQPEDIADAVVFLASDKAKYITGVTLPVDAGFTVK